MVMTHGLDYPAIRGTNMAVMVGHASLKEAESPNEFRWTAICRFGIGRLERMAKE